VRGRPGCATPREDHQVSDQHQNDDPVNAKQLGSNLLPDQIAHEDEDPDDGDQRRRLNPAAELALIVQQVGRIGDPFRQPLSPSAQMTADHEHPDRDEADTDEKRGDPVEEGQDGGDHWLTSTPSR
jgi:hypothetical protein